MAVFNDAGRSFDKEGKLSLADFNLNEPPKAVPRYTPGPRQAKAEIPKQLSEIDEILNERGARYGAFNRHAAITQLLKDAMKVHEEDWMRLSASKKECLEMIQHKIGRIINGDSNYLDSWVDIIGYVQLIINEIQESQANQELDKPF